MGEPLREALIELASQGIVLDDLLACRTYHFRRCGGCPACIAQSIAYAALAAPVTEPPKSPLSREGLARERDTYARLLRRAQEEMRLLHMKDLATVYDVTLRHEIATALSGVSEPASGVPSAEWIDQNSVQCDACHHEFVDLTAIKEGGKQHAIAGDSEGQGTGCAFCMDADAEMHAKESASERIRGGE